MYRHDIAQVNVISKPTVIKHERFAPYVDVVANVAGRNPSAVADEVNARLAKISFPLEYHPELLGEFAERVEVRNRMLAIGLACLIGTFLLLQACLRSWALATVTTGAMLVFAAGGVLMVALSGGSITTGSMIGLLVVLEISARHNVMLLSGWQSLGRDTGQGLDAQAVRLGSQAKVAPLLSSVLATFALMIPIIAGGSMAGLEIVRPMAIIIVGGVIASTRISLLVLPALYLRAGARSERQPELVLTA